MSEIRALIADDEPLARRGVRQLLERHGDVVVVGECRDGRETLRALETLAPNLVFLDVQMPELGGFEVLRAHGPERMPAVVFVTAYDEFAVRAFDAHALDYLVKPLSEARFEAALSRVRERLRFAEAIALATRLTALLSAEEVHRTATHAGAQGERDAGRPPAPGRRVMVPTATGELLIAASEIDWIDADDYYAGIHVGSKRYLIRESLSSLESRLDAAQFIRVHRSAIVRLDRVRELRSTTEGEIAVLRDGTRVPVSRRRRERLGELLRRSAR